jgi:hypothetical protein
MSTDQQTDEWASSSAGMDGYEMDAGNVNADELGGGGDMVNKIGNYHFEVSDVVADLDTVNSRSGKAKSPSIRFDLLVLHSVDKQSPAGSRMFHRIYVGAAGGGPPKEGAIKSALRFAIGLGLAREEEIEGVKRVVCNATNTTRFPLTAWLAAKGKHLMAKVIEEKQDEHSSGEPRFVIPFGRCYQPSDELVADWPKNVDLLVAAGYKLPPQGGAAAPKQPPQQQQKTPPKPAQPPQQKAPETVGGVDISDL